MKKRKEDEEGEGVPSGSYGLSMLYTKFRNQSPAMKLQHTLSMGIRVGIMSPCSCPQNTGYSLSGPSPGSIENQLYNLVSDTKVYIKDRVLFPEAKTADVKICFSSILD